VFINNSLFDKTIKNYPMFTNFFMGANYPALAIANYFIAKNTADTEPDKGIFTNLKLQKILYYAQGWYLGLYDLALFDDNIEAWDYGPVVPNVYYEFKENGANEITEQSKIYKDSGLTDKVKNHLNDIYEAYRKYEGTYLINTTHAEKPWAITYYSPNKIIDKGIIQEYFKFIAKRRGVRI